MSDKSLKKWAKMGSKRRIFAAFFATFLERI